MNVAVVHWIVSVRDSEMFSYCTPDFEMLLNVYYLIFRLAAKKVQQNFDYEIILLIYNLNCSILSGWAPSRFGSCNWRTG